jgi:hypothetical protein
MAGMGASNARLRISFYLSYLIFFSGDLMSINGFSMIINLKIKKLRC